MVSLDFSDPQDSEDPAGLIWLDWQDGSSELVRRGGRLCRRFLGPQPGILSLFPSARFLSLGGNPRA